MCTWEIMHGALRNNEPASFLYFLDNTVVKKLQDKGSQVWELISEESKQNLGLGSRLVKE